jgi:hypothetical protein
LRLPESAVLGDPGGGVLHGRGYEAAAMDSAINLAFEKAGGFEYAEMLGNGRERNAEGLGELRHGGFPKSKTSEDGAAGGIGESAEGGVERAVGIVNHMV